MGICNYCDALISVGEELNELGDHVACYAKYKERAASGRCIFCNEPTDEGRTDDYGIRVPRHEGCTEFHGY